MGLEVNSSTAQFMNFVNFAENQVKTLGKKGEESTAAILGSDGTNFGSHTITASSDSVGKLLRSQNMKDTNDAIRTIFKKSIADIFGGEKNIPDEVKNAMKLDDFGKGKPLTARRIMAVSVAVQNSIEVNGEAKNNYDIQMVKSRLKDADNDFINNLALVQQSKKTNAEFPDKLMRNIAQYMIEDKDEDNLLSEIGKNAGIELISNMAWKYNLLDEKKLNKLTDFALKLRLNDHNYSWGQDNELCLESKARELSGIIPKKIYDHIDTVYSKKKNTDFNGSGLLTYTKMEATDLTARMAFVYKLNEEKTTQLANFVSTLQLTNFHHSENCYLTENKAMELAGQVNK